MNQPKRGFVNVDELQAKTTLEQAAEACGHSLTEIRRSGKEARIPCPFHNAAETDRSLAVNVEHPQKVFICHSYQCRVRGNLLLLMHGWLHGNAPPGGKLTGTAFREVRDILTRIHGEVVAAIAEVETTAQDNAKATREAKAKAQRVIQNKPLKESDNEAASELVSIDEKFVRDVAQVNPAASRFLRQRPYLTPEVMAFFRMGYLPADGGGDKRGWSLRSHIIYPMLDESGELLAWIGRDPSYEQKHQEWEQAGKVKREPTKYRFPKGFHRGLELFGQRLLVDQAAAAKLQETGLIVVEGFNDVIRLWTLGQPSVAICSNDVAEGQLEKIAGLANQHGGGRVTLLFDCQETGDTGAKEALWKIAQTGVSVRLGWSRTMHGGKFADKQPEDLTDKEWQQMREFLTTNPTTHEG